ERNRFRPCDRRVPAADARRAPMHIVDLVVRRNLLEAVVEPKLDVRAGGGFGRGAQQTRVVRVAAEAAGDAQDPRHWRVSPPGFTNCSSARIVTSFASDGSPFGSGLFQSTPKSVRSIFVVRLRPMRSFPYGSAIGADTVPVTATGLVTPLIVNSPSTETWQAPSRPMSWAA